MSLFSSFPVSSVIILSLFIIIFALNSSLASTICNFVQLIQDTLNSARGVRNPTTTRSDKTTYSRPITSSKLNTSLSEPIRSTIRTTSMCLPTATNAGQTNRMESDEAGVAPSATLETDPVVKVFGREGENSEATLERLGFEGSGKNFLGMVSKAKADKMATLPGGMSHGYGEMFDASYHMLAGCTPVYDRFYFEAVAKQEKWLAERMAARLEEDSETSDHRDQDTGSSG